MVETLVKPLPDHKVSHLGAYLVGVLFIVSVGDRAVKGVKQICSTPSSHFNIFWAPNKLTILMKIQRTKRKASDKFSLLLWSIFISTENHRTSPAEREVSGNIKACWGCERDERGE
jgi:hypothetical protein